MNILGASALLIGACFLAAISAKAADQTTPQTPDAAKLDVDHYAQLHVELVIQEMVSGKIVVVDELPLNGCPNPTQEWPIDASHWKDSETTLGISVTTPEGTEQVLTPVDLKFNGGFSVSCDINLDKLNYDSPVYFVRASNGFKFHVVPVLTRSRKISGEVLKQFNTFVTTVAPLAGVSAAVATEVGSLANTVAQSIHKDERESLGDYLEIKAGDPPSHTWPVSAILPSATYKVTLVAKLVPVDTLIPTPKSGDWATGDVFNSRFHAGFAGTPNASRTLSQYLFDKYGADRAALEGAQTLAVAKTACNSMRTDVNAMALTTTDTALIMWALLDNRGPTTDAALPDLYNMQCVNDLNKYFPTAPTNYATLSQMQAAVGGPEIAALPAFMSGNWDARDQFGSQVFTYPLQMMDPDSHWFGTRSLSSNESWGTIPDDKKKPFVSKIGCYAFVPYDDKNYAGKVGKASVLLAIATLPATDADHPGAEVVLTLSFASATATGITHVNKIEIASGLSADIKTEFDARYKGKKSCLSGYAPKFLFGG